MLSMLNSQRARFDEHENAYTGDNSMDLLLTKIVPSLSLSRAAWDVDGFVDTQTGPQGITDSFILFDTATGMTCVATGGLGNNTTAHTNLTGRTTIATDPEMGEETATVTLHQRYIYRGYLQVAACDLMRGGHPCLWLITWDPTQPIATRPLAIQKDGTWYCYGWDLTKNVCEVFGQAGYIRTTYSYTPYGAVTGEGDVTQPLQWSNEYADPELGSCERFYTAHGCPIRG